MTKYYSPYTQEHINTTNPAPWMGVAKKAAPAYNPATQSCFYRSGKWVVEDIIQPQKTIEEIYAQRIQAYMHESDPLFMEWQYNQTPESEQKWRNKVAEIKERYSLNGIEG